MGYSRNEMSFMSYVWRCDNVDTMLWIKYLFYSSIFISQRCWHVLGTLVKAVIKPYIPQRYGHDLSAILKNNFIYLFHGHISLGAFVLRKWNIKACSDIIYAD